MAVDFIPFCRSSGTVWELKSSFSFSQENLPGAQLHGRNPGIAEAGKAPGAPRSRAPAAFPSATSAGNPTPGTRGVCAREGIAPDIQPRDNAPHAQLARPPPRGRKTGKSGKIGKMEGGRAVFQRNSGLFSTGISGQLRLFGPRSRQPRIHPHDESSEESARAPAPPELPRDAELAPGCPRPGALHVDSCRGIAKEFHRNPSKIHKNP